MNEKFFIAASLPKPAGCYVIGDNLSIQIRKKPHAIARFLCRWLLDWHWKDEPQ